MFVGRRLLQRQSRVYLSRCVSSTIRSLGQWHRAYSTGLSSRDTIFAVATGRARAAVSVIRVSGPQAHEALQSLSNGAEPKHGQAVVRTLHKQLADGADVMLDQAMVLRFDAPKSFTGEDVVELHTHGGTAVVAGVLDALASFPGLRHAEPGEFTRRAFLNNKMDLTQIEGLADLINAETEAQRTQALHYISGKAAQLYDGWRSELLMCMAHVEAFIDFGEDEGIEDNVMAEALDRVRVIREDMVKYVKDSPVGERLRHGVRIAIVGKPDVGKSSLLNLLSGREAAIVASGPGTTRDIVEVPANIAGYPVLFQDTAGLRAGQEVGDVEREGIRRAEAAASTADIRICVQDGSADRKAICARLENGDFEEKFGERFGKDACHCSQNPGPATIVLLNKADIHNISVPHGTNGDAVQLAVSCTTGVGTDTFLKLLSDRVVQLCSSTISDAPVIIQARHRDHIRNCIEAIDRVLNDPADVVVAAEELRFASEQFGYITGRFEIEEILDVVFQEFCIGK